MKTGSRDPNEPRRSLRIRPKRPAISSPENRKAKNQRFSAACEAPPFQFRGEKSGLESLAHDLFAESGVRIKHTAGRRQDEAIPGGSLGAGDEGTGCDAARWRRRLPGGGRRRSSAYRTGAYGVGGGATSSLATTGGSTGGPGGPARSGCRGRRSKIITSCANKGPRIIGGKPWELG